MVCCMMWNVRGLDVTTKCEVVQNGVVVKIVWLKWWREIAVVWNVMV